MKLIAIIGEPATGKSDLMKAILKRLGNGTTNIYRPLIDYPKGSRRVPLTYTKYSNERYVLGVYENEKELFPGTDKLINTVVDSVRKFLHEEVGQHAVVVFEGDKLTRIEFFKEVEKKYNLRLYVLECSRYDLTYRRIIRNINLIMRREKPQSPTFFQKKQSGITNITTDFDNLNVPYIPLPNDNKDFEKNVDKICAEIG